MKTSSITHFINLIDPKSALKFLTVGAISAVVYFASFTLLWKFFGLNYKLAVSIGYVLSVIVHFTANRVLTFRSHGQQLFQHIARYLVMITINYLITLAVVHLMVAVLKLSPYLGIVLSIGSTTGLGYLMAKFWVFRTTLDKN